MHAIKAAGVRIPPLGDGGGYLGAVTHQARGKPRVGTADGSVSFERRALPSYSGQEDVIAECRAGLRCCPVHRCVCSQPLLTAVLEVCRSS